MKIGIDYHLVSRNPTSGMGVYVSEIAKALKNLDRENKYLLFDGAFLYEHEQVSFIQKILGVFAEEYWIQFSIVKEALSKKIELFYSPNPPVPFFLFKPIILTIPDLSFVHDESMNVLVKIFLFFIYFVSAHKAKIITTFSDNSKGDIARVLGIDEGKIYIVTPGVSDSFGKVDGRKILEVKKHYGITKNYILSLPGTFIARKNAKGLITAFKKLSLHLRQKYEIVFVGNKNDNNYIKFRDYVISQKVTDNVICVGYVPEEHLAALYAGAQVFVSTSLYEGFGLPVVQAMACGAPVIAYKNSSLVDLIGNTGLLTTGDGDLSHALKVILENESKRRLLIKMGLGRAKMFTWNNSACDLARLIGKIS